MSELCHFCGKPATKLCDHPKPGSNGLYSLEAGTCDLPTCDGCCVRKGISFDLRGPGEIDTVDHCLFHSEVDRRELIKVVK